MLDKILIAVDEQSVDSPSVRFADILSKRFGSKIYLLNVIPGFDKFVNAFEEQEKYKLTDWIDNKFVPEKRAVMESIKLSFNGCGLDCDILTKQGIPYQEIINTGIEKGVDLLILDRERHHRRSILGGTAQKVLRNSEIPILTFNNKPLRIDIKKILLPIDLYHVIMKFSLSKLFDYIKELSRAFDAEITKLYVIEQGNHRLPLEVIEKIKEDCLNKLSAAGSNGFLSAVELNTNAWSGILNYAESNNSDLIVLTRYAGKDFRPKFLGSTAEKVIQEAPCPVITIHP